MGGRSLIGSLVVALALVAGVSFAPAAIGARHAARCPHGQTRKTVAYAVHKHGPVHHATGCRPRSPAVPRSFGAGLRAMRAFVTKLTPARILRLRRGKQARRGAAGDHAADVLLSGVARRPGASAAARSRSVFSVPVARAADANITTETGPNGTKIILRNDEYMNLDTAEVTGESFDSTIEAASTPSAKPGSATSAKNVRVKHLMDRCPDSGGTAKGTYHLSVRETRALPRPQGGQAIVTAVSTLDAHIVAHFGDDARIKTIAITGTWSFAMSTRILSRGRTTDRSPRRAESGGVSAKNFRNGGGSMYFDLDITKTTASDGPMALTSDVLGSVAALALAHEDMKKMLADLETHVHGGGCVTIVPDPETVHVYPGRSVAIVAHLVDHHKKTFTGSITATNGAGRVSPSEARGSPDARFTYAAPASAKPGDTDAVQLRHVSKRGTGHGGLVKVIVDRVPFPTRFDGTWTRTFTSSARPGWIETVTGNATYGRNALFPVAAEGLAPIEYDVLTANVTWLVTGSNPAPGCGTVTYSGSHTAPADFNGAGGGTGLVLDDLTKRGGDPARPFQYSIRASGDPDNVPTFHVAYTGCPVENHDEPIDDDYLDIGTFSSSTPEDVETSATARKLEGQRSRPEGAGPATEDAWSFTGTGP